MPVIPYVHRPSLLLIGLGVFIVGWLLRRWAGRHDMMGVVTGAATGAAWQAVKGRKVPDMPGALKSKMQEFQAEGSNVGRAKKVAGYAARHFIAQVVGVMGWIGLLAGLGLMAAGMFWK
jgi:hypothetical protein